MQQRRTNSGSRLASRALVAGVGAAALLCGVRAGADGDAVAPGTGPAGTPDAPAAPAPAPAEPRPGTWFRSPVSGTRFVAEWGAATGEKSLVAPDGRRFPTVQSIVEAETRALSPIERLMPPDLIALAADPARAAELADVTFLFARQPAYEAGVAARAWADPLLQAELAREHAILDRIAPLRTMPGGRAPDVATAMRDEAALLTPDEKDTLREARDAINAILAKMRREIMAQAATAVAEDQAALAAFLRGLPDAIDFGGSVTLNARSARIPAHALAEIAHRFPEVMRIERVTQTEGCLDNAVATVGAAGWWNAGYNGSSSTIVGVVDSGVDGGHPALSSVIAGAAVYHAAAAASGATYGDTSTSTDDLQGHGTAVAGIIVSTDTTYRGIAFGGQILNAKAAYYNTAGTANMYPSDGRSAADWAITQGATSLLLNYGGAGVNNGTSEWELFFDAASSSLSIPGVLAAKDLGPNTSTVGYPGGAFNVLTCGCTDDNATSGVSDDFLFAPSGRGPTTDGRQKPDVCAPGVAITTTAFDWEGSNSDFTSFTPGTNLSGTSTVGPLVSGAISLLQDYGAAAYPTGYKALLLTAPYKSVLTSIGSSTSYTAPDNNIGYGLLDCGPAYTYRGSVYEGQLTSSGPRYVLLRGGSLASGGRATLVWSRHVTSAGAAIPTTYYSIQDLDFYAYEESSGTQVGTSVSTVDPNEQIAVSSAVTSPIYKVYRAATTFTSSYTSEPFAVAAESASSTTVLTPPALATSYTQFTNTVAGSADTVVTVLVANSGTATAIAPSVALTLPSGYSITTGANPRTLSSLAGGASTSVSWTIHTPASPSGVGTITVNATSTSYGESIAASALNRNQTVDADPPSATVAISDGAPYTTTRDVTVALTASDNYTGVAQMRVRNAGAAWGAWTSVAASVNTTLPASDGTKTFEAQFVDGVGNVGPTVSDSIVYDTTPPSATLQIAAGASWANSASVALSNNAADVSSGVAESRFSNDGINWDAWAAYAPSASWTLTTGDGTRTVYAQYRDGAGNVSASVTDSIVIETGLPTGSVVILGGAAGTNLRDVTLTLAATDAVSGVRDMRLSADGTDWNAWQDYATSAAWSFPAGDGVKPVYVQFRDNAGNVSATATDDIILDTVPPSGTIAILGDASFTPSSAVTLDLAATDAINGVVEMRFANDPANWGPWMTYATTAPWTLTAGEGKRTVFAQFKDGAGNVSSPTTDAINVDTMPPTGTVAIQAGAAAINTSDVTLNLTFADPGSGVASVRFSNDGTDWAAWVAVKATLPWTMDAGDGTHTVHAQFRDNAGNDSATASDTILLDSVAPTGTFVLSGGAAYVMPWTAFTADTTATDGAGGSGVASFRSSDDGGASWSPWTPIGGDGRAIVPRPAAGADRLVTIDGQIRDVAGNVSATTSDSAFLVSATAASVTQAAAYAGTAGLTGDVDAVRMGLVAGDRLTLKLKAKALVAKADAHVEIDIYGPGENALVTGRYPATAKTPGVTNYVAPQTGEYWIVLRSAGTAAGSGVGYTMSVNDVAAKGSRAKKGTAAPDGGAQPPAATIAFDGVEGLKFTGTLTLPLADVTTVPTLTGPDGSVVPITFVRGKKGSMKISALALVGGAGTYELSIPASGAVAYSFALAPPKRGKLAE